MTRSETVRWLLRKYGEDITVNGTPCRGLVSQLKKESENAPPRWHCVLPAGTEIAEGVCVTRGGARYLTESCGETVLGGGQVCAWALLCAEGGALYGL